MRRRHLKSKSSYRVLWMHTALQSFNSWHGHIHRQLYKCVVSLLFSFCSWCWKLALHAAHSVFQFCLVVPWSKVPYFTVWLEQMHSFISEKAWSQILMQIVLWGLLTNHSGKKTRNQPNLTPRRCFIPLTHLISLQTSTYFRLLHWCLYVAMQVDNAA